MIVVIAKGISRSRTLTYEFSVYIKLEIIVGGKADYSLFCAAEIKFLFENCVQIFKVGAMRVILIGINLAVLNVDGSKV